MVAASAVYNEIVRTLEIQSFFLFSAFYLSNSPEVPLRVFVISLYDVVTILNHVR